MPANKTDTVWFAAAIKKHTHEKKFDRKPRMIQRFNHVFFLLLRIKRIFDRFFDLGVPFDYYVLWTHGQNKRKERACCKLHRVSMTLFFGANELLVWFLIISNNQVRMCCICWVPNISIHSNISPNQPELVMLSIGPGIYQFIILNVFQIKKPTSKIVSFSKIGKNLQMTIALCLCMQCTESGVVNFFITFCALRALGFACANAQCDCRVLLVLSHNPMSTLDIFT